MTEDEARSVERMLRRLDRPGVAAPASPGEPAGEWCIYDRPEHGLRSDITAQVLDALIDHGDESVALPAGGRPVRGFVIPGYGRT